MTKKISYFFILLCLFGLLAACQSISPTVDISGLPQLDQTAAKTADYQVEIIRGKKSTAFLWLQQFENKQYIAAATSLTGQLLFQLSYQDGKLTINNRLDELKKMPVEYMLRDMIWATYPIKQIKPVFYGTLLKVTVHDNERFFYQDGKLIVKVRYLEQGIIKLINKKAHYTLFITPLN